MQDGSGLVYLGLIGAGLGHWNCSIKAYEKALQIFEKLVDSAYLLFSDAAQRYSEVAALPRVNIPSLQVYANLDKGLSFSVKNITERDDKKAVTLLDNAVKEFKNALKFADQKEKLRLQGIISEHEAKRFIRLAYIEKEPGNQNRMLDKAIGALEDAVKSFEKLGDEKLCDIRTCEGCRHLFSGLMSFREGVKEKSKRQIDDAVSELHEARLCYESALNELGKETVETLNTSFDFVDEIIECDDQERTTKVTNEFIKIIEELSSAGLQKIVKLYTFDESMNAKITSGVPIVTQKSDSFFDKLHKFINRLANPASIAAFIFFAILNLKKEIHD
jgi:tetratricopeptide (TPR) repeat protein